MEIQGPVQKVEEESSTDSDVKIERKYKKEQDLLENPIIDVVPQEENDSDISYDYDQDGNLITVPSKKKLEKDAKAAVKGPRHRKADPIVRNEDSDDIPWF